MAGPEISIRAGFIYYNIAYSALKVIRPGLGNERRKLFVSSFSANKDWCVSTTGYETCAYYTPIILYCFIFIKVSTSQGYCSPFSRDSIRMEDDKSVGII